MNKLIKLYNHPNHELPNNMVIEAGRLYRYKCPNCDKEQVIHGKPITFSKLMQKLKRK